MAGVVDSATNAVSNAATGVTSTFGTAAKIAKPVVIGASVVAGIGVLSTVGWPGMVANIGSGASATAGFLSSTAQWIAAHTATAASTLSTAVPAAAL